MNNELTVSLIDESGLIMITGTHETDDAITTVNAELLPGDTLFQMDYEWWLTQVKDAPKGTVRIPHPEPLDPDL